MKTPAAPLSFAIVVVGVLPPDVKPEDAEAMLLPMFSASLLVTAQMRTSALMVSNATPQDLIAGIAAAIPAPSKLSTQ